jgi:hypothetical protein
MPTKDKSQFALINRIRGKTSYFAHLTAQQDLNDGKTKRMNSNGGYASIMSEYGAGYASFTESEIKNLIVKDTPIINVPIQPTMFSSNSFSSSGFTISWLGGTGATSYTYTLNGISATPSVNNGVASRSATFSGLQANTSYTIIVTSVNAAGSTNSSSYTITTLPNPPLVSSSLSSSSITSSGFTVNWLGGSGATSYIYTLNGIAATPSVNNGVASRSATFSALQANTSYTIIVTAVNEGGSTNSSSYTITTLPRNSLINSGSTDTFIFKYLADGTAQWAKNIGGTLIDQAVITISDTAGNLYVSGHYTSPTLNIPGFSPDNLTRSGSSSSFSDIFILKYLADGTPQWAKNIGGTGTDQPVNMVVDSTGNVYVSGYYGSSPLNIPEFEPNNLTLSGTNDVFILKYLADGRAQWAKNIGGTGTDRPVNMVVDSTGNLYVSGYYGSSPLNIPEFEPNNLTLSGTNDVFILKYNSSGIPQWAKKIGGTGDDRPVSIGVDSTGNLYVSGYYASTSTVLIEGLIRLGATGGINNAFAVKYSANGTAQWATSLGGSAVDQSVNMVVDSAGNVYVSGYYSSSAMNFYYSTSTSDDVQGFKVPSNNGGEDIFISKSLGGNYPLQWIKNIGGTANDRPVNMVIDSAGNVYVSGTYTSPTLNITGFSPTTLTNYGGTDTYILKYSANGTPQWAKNIGGTAVDQPVNMVVDSAGNLYVSGTYTSPTLNIPEFSPDTLTRSASNDAFILKYLANGTPQWAKNIGGTGNDRPVNMVVDSIGNLYVSGTYTSPHIAPSV